MQMSGRLSRRRWPLLAGVAALLFGGGVGTAHAGPSKIVYAAFSEPSETDQLFTVRSDGTHGHQLTEGSASSNIPTSTDPSWSPHQKKIVFARQTGGGTYLFTMRADGTHLHQILHTEFAGEPSWSPRGNRIAYSVENSHLKSAIFTIGLNGKHRKRLTAFSHNGSPDWSPNGKSIVFTSSHRIVRMRANGHHKTVVSSSGDEPAWSPNGKLIAFQDDAGEPVAVSDIYTIHANGTHRHNVTGTRPGTSCPDDPEECNREDEWPSWSPTGKRLLFDETSSGNGDAGIFTVKPSGAGARQVAKTGHEADWR
jgi:Tol biopolymer transport system component